MEKSERMNYKEVADLLWNNVFSKEKSIIWVGSGLSNNYYLCWEDIIDKLCANCGIENNDNFLDIADKCKEANPQKYFDTLYSEYGKNTHQYRSAHLQLFNINTNSILTTNFDSIIVFKFNYLFFHFFIIRNLYFLSIFSYFCFSNGVH